jgi:hypothetical protein
MTPSLRKLALLAHVAASVASLGAVAAFLALALVGLASSELQVVRACYVAMGLITAYVIVPAIVVAPVTGVLSSLGTSWGLFRYYWIIVKLALTAIALLVLLLQISNIDHLARFAMTSMPFGGDLDASRLELVVHAAGGLVVLLTATVLAVFKPQGLTRYGLQQLPKGNRQPV